MKRGGTITIRDATGQEVTRIETDDPKFSFEQYCRNRDTTGWTYDSAAEGGVDQPGPDRIIP
jgi:hypothetical protein